VPKVLTPAAATAVPPNKMEGRADQDQGDVAQRERGSPRDVPTSRLPQRVKERHPFCVQHIPFAARVWVGDHTLDAIAATAAARRDWRMRGNRTMEEARGIYIALYRRRLGCFVVRRSTLATASDGSHSSA
jgi:hypothetical protein